MYALLKVTLIVSSLVFGLSFIVRTEKDSIEQQQTDVKVSIVSGILFLSSGLALWVIGW